MQWLVRALRRRMVVKIFLAIGLVVGAALFALAWWQSSDEIAELKGNTQSSAEQLARVLVGNIETTMLAGDGILVKEQVQRLEFAVPDADIHIYDPKGLEVFGTKPPPPDKSWLPTPLALTLADGRERVEAGRDWRPIANDTACHECHPSGPKLRGVLALVPVRGDARPARDTIVSSLITDAFIQIMTARQKDQLDRFFAELSTAAPALRAIGVYDGDGDLAFGVAVGSVTKPILRTKLVAGATRSSLASPDGTVELVPLAMQKRCEQCHENDAPMRGVLAIAFAAPASSPDAELVSVIETSLRYIMLSSLGRLIGAFLDDVVATGAVSELALFDDTGRTYYTSKPPPPEPQVADAIGTRAGSASFVGDGRDERVRVVQPLANDDKCARCHGEAPLVRGVVSVSLSTGRAAEVREASRARATLLIGLALVAVLCVLYALLQILVAAPMQKIGTVADAVGLGQLDVTIADSDPHGDEVHRLGNQINEMIRGLRTEFHMRRFVSRGAAAAARGAAQSATSGRAAPIGERRPTTVLFTDIRGFTAYSETVAPEQVVEMLNRFLQVQADVVERFGGDIDKYVGDELMAVFHGDDGAVRAVRAGVEMVAAVDQARVAGETLAVGCGISTGEVVYGPIGSQNRMDFTVIGDVVNTGARLCSAAGGGEVLVSGVVRQACGDVADIAFVATEPLQLKGKRQPLEAFRATRVDRDARRADGGAP